MFELLNFVIVCLSVFFVSVIPEVSNRECLSSHGPRVKPEDNRF